MKSRPGSRARPLLLAVLSASFPVLVAACAKSAPPPTEPAAEPSVRVLSSSEIPPAMRAKLFPRNMPGLPTEDETLASIEAIFAKTRDAAGKTKTPPKGTLKLAQVRVTPMKTTCSLMTSYRVEKSDGGAVRKVECGGLVDMKKVVAVRLTRVPVAGADTVVGLLFEQVPAKGDRGECVVDAPLDAATTDAEGTRAVLAAFDNWRTLCGAPGTTVPPGG